MSLTSFLAITPHQFTFWMLVLTLLSAWTYKYIDLLFLSLLCLTISTFIGYVYPGRFSYIDNGERVYVEGPQKHWVHIVYHVLPFAYLAWRYGGYYRKSSLFSKANPTPQVVAICAVILYISVFRPDEIYELNGIAFTWIFLVCVLVYAVQAM